MSWASWRPGGKSFKGGSFNSEPGAKMRENKTRLLLILSQDMLDQARVIAGRATTVLKLPVSLQIVFRALIGVGLKRDASFLPSPAPPALRRCWRTALAWLSILAKSAAWLSRFSPTPISARKTIWRLTGSLSTVVALPAMTRA